MKNSLKRIREERRMTLDELAQLSGYGKSTINNFENSKTDASEAFLKKIASVLKTSVAEILDESAVHEAAAEYRASAKAEIMAVVDGGPALAAINMTDDELVLRIKEHSEELQQAPTYMRGPQAEIISAFALELYKRSKKKAEEP